jgi:hypothetical protein
LKPILLEKESAGFRAPDPDGEAEDARNLRGVSERMDTTGGFRARARTVSVFPPSVAHTVSKMRIE